MGIPTDKESLDVVVTYEFDVDEVEESTEIFEEPPQILPGLSEITHEIPTDKLAEKNAEKHKSLNVSKNGDSKPSCEINKPITKRGPQAEKELPPVIHPLWKGDN